MSQRCMPKLELRGKYFRYCCETAPLVIQDNELIVGNPTGAPRAGAFSPDIAWRWMQDELETIGTKDQDPFYISEEDKKYMKEVLFPFWKHRSVDEFCEDQYRECGGWELSGESFVSDCSYHAVNGGGDSNPGYDVITMKKGMKDIQNEAREKLAALDYANPDDIDKIYFYKSVIDTTEGVMIYAKRLSDYAFQLAAKETNPVRRKELEKIGEVNAKVPANKPETFWEAIQAVWTIESLLPVEENQTGMSIGRVDQYMYPFYKADIESGRMTDYEAFELASCMLIKMSEMMWVTSEGGSKFFAGYQPFVNMCVGGVTRAGVLSGGDGDGHPDGQEPGDRAAAEPPLGGSAGELRALLLPRGFSEQRCGQHGAPDPEDVDARHPVVRGADGDAGGVHGRPADRVSDVVRSGDGADIAPGDAVAGFSAGAALDRAPWRRAELPGGAGQLAGTQLAGSDQGADRVRPRGVPVSSGRAAHIGRHRAGRRAGDDGGDRGTIGVGEEHADQVGTAVLRPRSGPSSRGRGRPRAGRSRMAQASDRGRAAGEFFVQREREGQHRRGGHVGAPGARDRGREAGRSPRFHPGAS